MELRLQLSDLEVSGGPLPRRTIQSTPTVFFRADPQQGVVVMASVSVSGGGAAKAAVARTTYKASEKEHDVRRSNIIAARGV